MLIKQCMSNNILNKGRGPLVGKGASSSIIKEGCCQDRQASLTRLLTYEVESEYRADRPQTSSGQEF